MILAQYTGSNDVAFATSRWDLLNPSEFRNSYHSRDDDQVIVPLRIEVNPERSIKKALEEVQTLLHRASMHGNHKTPEQGQQSLETEGTVRYQNQLIVSLDDCGSGLAYAQVLKNCWDGSVHGPCNLTVLCTRDSATGILCGAVLKNSRQHVESNVIREENLDRMMHQFVNVAQQILVIDQESRIGLLELASPQDLFMLKKWNGEDCQKERMCLHDLVSSQARSQPGTTAVVAWDGELSYRDLDVLSTGLASHLTQTGVSKGEVVPLFFEKSMWTIVAMMAVLKAGAVCVAVSANYPLQAVKEVVCQTKSRIILASESKSPALQGLDMDFMVVSKESVTNWSIEESSFRPKVVPSDTAFIIFTSGSTGKPKGIVFDHSALATSMKFHSRSLNIHSHSRVLQFSSYAFDVSIYEIFTTLTRGGCVVVPSEAQRMNNLGEFIRTNNVTWAWFTPSFLRTLQPYEVGCLLTIAVGGEAVTQDIADTWAGKVELINGYGPAECTICASGLIHPGGWNPGTIGRTIGCTSWITHPSNPEQLAAVGAIGELLIEGPVLAQGYLNEPLKTKMAFIKSPTWAQKFGHNLQEKTFYRTGDLVRYEEDGIIRCIGRNDSQVKVNGQRVDMGGVECAIQQVDASFNVIVESVTPKGDGQEKVLAAFISPKRKKGASNSNNISDAPMKVELRQPGSDLVSQISRIKSRLSETLPHFMIPTFFIPLSHLPLTVTGKTDRRRLQNVVNCQSRAEILQGMKHKEAEKSPMTKTETVLRAIVGSILGVDEEAINMNEGFFEIGGDSLAAIKLISLAREQHMDVTFEEVLRSSSLLHLTKVVRHGSSSSSLPSKNFAYFENEETQRSIRRVAREKCQIDDDEIEDIYPCTPLQEGLIVSTFKNPGMYMSRFVYALPNGVDADRFRSAWNAVVDSNPILRTKIIQTDSGQMFQVVVRHKVTGREHSDFREYAIDESEGIIHLGKELIRYSLIGGRDANGSFSLRFALAIHHSLYDGWSLSIILKQVEIAYEGKCLESSQFFPFVEHIRKQSRVEAFAFWSSQLSNLNATTFPTLPSAHYVPISNSSSKFSLPISVQNTGNYTVSTKIRLAWAILLSLYTESEDVVFGTTVSGRTAPLSGIEKIVGPTIATIPIRMVLKSDMTIQEGLEMVRTHSVSMIPFEHTGLQNISQIGPDAAAACNFQNLLVIQPQPHTDVPELFSVPEIASGDLDTFTTYVLTLLCSLKPDSLGLEIIFDRNAIGEDQVQRIMQQFGSLLQRMDEIAFQPIGEVEFLSPEDALQLTKWNAREPDRVDSCVHHLIQSHCQTQPNQPAVCAWDGDLTYAELDSFSSLVACQLRRFGIVPNVFVPLLFEKSKWTIVAMLAVMKTGGAFVLLDSNQPQQRQQQICRETGALLIVSSKANAQKSESLAPNIVIVGDGTFSSTSENLDQLQEIQPCPRDVVYIVFTSGSTGKPKGVMIEHSSYASAAKAHGKQKRIGLTTRALQLSSYAFDACMVEMLTVLIGGGCVCVASEEECRNDISMAITRFRVNWLCITPSVLKLLDPNELPNLKTIMAVGESMAPDQVELWTKQVELFVGYGPAECSAAVSAQPVLTTQSDPRNIGHGLGGCFWIVNKNNPNVLMPIGAIGELLIEGPVVGRGYINEIEKTKAAFLESTVWLDRFRERPWERLYRTGDLVRYNPDGTCNYVGRRDRQIKLRGQRLELGEVEHRLREAFPHIKDVVVEVIQPKGTISKPMLAAFIKDRNQDLVQALESWKAVIFMPPSESFYQEVLIAERELRNVLPNFMVPSVFLRLHQIPLTPTGKTNRREVQAQTAELSTEEILYLGSVPQSQVAPHLLPDEDIALFINERVVDLTRSEGKAYKASIHGRNVNISRVGLDSIDLMALATSVSRNFDVNISVSRFFSSSATVRDIAQLVKEAKDAVRPLKKIHEVDVFGEFQALNAELSKVMPHPTDDARPQQGQSGRIFLTGATGFLGAEILKQLLLWPEAKPVVVLVRAKTRDHAMARVVKSAKVGQWWKEDYWKSIEAWPGDLSEPKFGLADSQWDILCGRTTTKGDWFDAIIHNGAVVHWNTDYVSLKASNVMSTFQLLSLLSQSASPMRLTYISAGLADAEGKGDRELGAMLAPADGYSQTKFISELLVKSYAEKNDHNCGRNRYISIVRPGLIIGTAENGVSNVDDFIWRMVSAALSIGAYNAEEDNSWIMVSAVDQVAKLIVQESYHGDFGLKSTVLTDGISVGNFWRAIERGLKCKLERYSSRRWLDAVGMHMESVGKAHPLWPVLHFVESTNGCIGNPTAAESRAHIQAESIEASLIRSAQYLTSVGTLPAAGASSTVLRVAEDSVFRRSRRI